MNNLRSRVEALELAAEESRGVRSFNTFDGEWFVETTSCVFDYRQALIGANGHWPSWLRDALFSREQVEQLALDGWDVDVVEWADMSDWMFVRPDPSADDSPTPD